MVAIRRGAKRRPVRSPDDRGEGVIRERRVVQKCGFPIDILPIGCVNALDPDRGVLIRGTCGRGRGDGARAARCRRLLDRRCWLSWGRGDGRLGGFGRRQWETRLRSNRNGRWSLWGRRYLRDHGWDARGGGLPRGEWGTHHRGRRWSGAGNKRGKCQSACNGAYGLHRDSMPGVD